MRKSPAWKTVALALVALVLMLGSGEIADWLWVYWDLDRVLPSLFGVTLFGVLWGICFMVLIAILVHVPGFDKTLGKL